MIDDDPFRRERIMRLVPVFGKKRYRVIESTMPADVVPERLGAAHALGHSSIGLAGVGVSAPAGLKIGIEATCWHNDRGFGRYVRAVVGALLRLDTANDYTLFMDAPPRALPPELEGHVRVIASKVPASVAASASGHRSASDMWRLSRALADPSFNLLIFPSIYSFVPVFSRARKIVFIYDVIADTFPLLTTPKPRARLFWKAKTVLGLAQADAVATLSEYSRRGVMQMHRVPPERVHVVGCASDPIFRRLDRPEPTERLRSLGLAGAGRLVTYVGGFSPHKNLLQLVAAFYRIAMDPEFDDVRLVLVGEFANEVFHSHIDAIRDLIAEFEIEDRVVFTGYLPDEDIVVLHNRSTVLVLPSLMEGFGLPAIEAAACGCPVIATTESPLPQLLGEGGLYIDPRSCDQLPEALHAVLASEELRARMSAAGLEAAARLTWDSAARQLQSLIHRVVAR
jgi:glycosyltransferase involved in cell wall biosynthesis